MSGRNQRKLKTLESSKKLREFRKFRENARSIHSWNRKSKEPKRASPAVCSRENLNGPLSLWEPFKLKIFNWKAAWKLTSKVFKIRRFEILSEQTSRTSAAFSVATEIPENFFGAVAQLISEMTPEMRGDSGRFLVIPNNYKQSSNAKQTQQTGSLNRLQTSARTHSKQP